MVQAGELVEPRFEFVRGELVVTDRRTLRPGDITWIGADDIHTVEASEASSTLHF